MPSLALIGRLFRGLADRLDEPPGHPMMPAAEQFTFPAGLQPAWRYDEDQEEARRLTALELVDDDTLGYLTLRVRRVSRRNAVVEISADLDPELWPAVTATLARIVLEADR